MWTLIIAFHFILCIFLILTILLQSGKGSDMGAAFGGSSQTVFGSSGGATLLTKLTTWIAVGFLVTSLSLAYLSTKKRESNVVKEVLKTEKKADTKTEGSMGEGQAKPDEKADK